jgi:hypothetical protein
MVSHQPPQSLTPSIHAAQRPVGVQMRVDSEGPCGAIRGAFLLGAVRSRRGVENAEVAARRARHPSVRSAGSRGRSAAPP